MALINCKECNKEVSDKAESCPNCGNPISEKCVIKLHRESGFYTDKIRKYKIFIDGKDTFSEIMEGDELEFIVNHGQHEIYLRIDWCTSRKIRFTTNNLSEVQFKCRPNANPLLILLYITIFSSSYIHLEPISTDISH